MDKKKVTIAVAVAAVVTIAAMSLYSDLKTGEAAGDYQQSMDDGGWGSPVWVPEDQSWWDTWLCNWFGDC